MTVHVLNMLAGLVAAITCTVLFLRYRRPPRCRASEYGLVAGVPAGRICVTVDGERAESLGKLAIMPCSKCGVVHIGLATADGAVMSMDLSSSEASSASNALEIAAVLLDRINRARRPVAQAPATEASDGR